MAGIFDNFSTLNLTPEELKQLQLRQAGGGLAGAVEGEYLPRAEGIESDRPRIGADPVSSQEQSRVSPKQGGRTFYANTQGDIGTSVPKGSGTSGVYDAIEETVDNGVGKASGVLGKFGRVAGKALGPVSALTDFVNPEMLADGELTPEQQQVMAQQAVANMGPQMAGDAVNFAGGVADRAVGRAMGRPGVDLRDPQQPQSNLFDQSRSPRQELPEEVQQAALEAPATVDTPVGQAAPGTPVNPEQQVAQRNAQQETVRQATEQASVQALTSGQLTRPKAAEAVVQADAKRAGVELTPEQTKVAVKEELTNMKGMDNSQLGKYLSYAAIAGGLIASFMDKSGTASNMFAQSFNKQLDRNVTMGLAQRKAAAAQAQFDAKQKMERDKLQRTDRGLGIREKEVEQQGQYQSAQIGLGQERNQIFREGQASTNAYRGASLGMRQQSMAQRAAEAERDQQNWEKMFGFKEAEAKRDQGNQERRIRQGDEGLLFRAHAAANSAVGKGPDVTTKDAESAIKATADAQGVNLDKAVLKNAAQQFRARIKADPRGAQSNTTGIINDILNSQGFQQEPGRQGLIWDSAPSIKLK